MNLEYTRTRMSNNAEAIRNLVQDIEPRQARWRPAPDSWSILEVINHLFDEEREDFRRRLMFILDQETGTMPPIDPAGWVTERNYNERELQESLDGFLAERESSLAWLAKLNSPDWDAFYEAPFGRMRAGDMLASWLAHDQLHMRQLVELQFAWLAQLTQPYSAEYAGAW